MNQQLLRKRDVISLLRISASSLHRLVRAGELRVVRVRPGAVRIPLRDVEALIRKRTERRWWIGPPPHEER